MFNSENLTPQQVIAGVQQGLVIIRNAMDVADALYAWSSGVAPADLTSLTVPGGQPMPEGDAEQLLAACADAHAMSLHYNAGVADGTYPSGYSFGASQRIVIGPRPV